jgi:phosphoglycolate phosphatase
VGLPPLPDEAFLSRVGLPLADIFAQIVPELDDARRDAVVAAYRAGYADMCRAHTRIFDGMRELLDALRRRGTAMAIATGKSTSGAHSSLERLALDAALFRCVVGTDAVPRPKPHGDMVDHILAELGASPEEAVVVGDTSFDMEMSVAAGVRACGVTWGSHTREVLLDAGATWVTDTREQLSALLSA